MCTLQVLLLPQLWWQNHPLVITAGIMPCYLASFQQLKAKLEANHLSLPGEASELTAQGTSLMTAEASFNSRQDQFAEVLCYY